MLSALQQELKKLANPEKAKLLAKYFKTGPGEYGEGDVFLGIVVPEQRKLAKKYPELSLEELQKLLSSKIHEHRLVALLILVEQYKKQPDARQKILNFYFKNTKHINNWDLVDLSAPNIVGEYFWSSPEDKERLYELASSSNLWERRIAILATFAFIRKNHFYDSLWIAEMRLKDKEDLIHKAVGWMLREVGKRNQKEEEEFLNKHYKTMPRTMLRYAIEKFEEGKRKKYLRK